MRKNMKRSILLILVLALTGCKENAGMTNEEADTSVSFVTEEGTGIDYDLTLMNQDMVYATVLQMLTQPESYFGKTVKMEGAMNVYTNQDNSIYYPACVIKDALACCQQGMEFVLKDAQYPDDYPETGSNITVIGTFEEYYEGEYRFFHLTDAILVNEDDE